MDIYLIEALAAIEKGHGSIILKNCRGEKDSSKYSVLGSSLLNVPGRV